MIMLIFSDIVRLLAAIAQVTIVMGTPAANKNTELTAANIRNHTGLILF